MTRFGYNGRLLHVDLSTDRIWSEEPDENWWRLYGGGGLLATEQLLRHTPAGIDPLSAQNVLIFTSSVLAGHPYAGLARFTVAAKSPLTNGIGETRCEGPFGMALKMTGSDALIIHGQSAHPVTLHIRDSLPTLEASSELWGLPVGATVDRLQETYGNELHSAMIGPAGENLVRFASIVTNRTHQAARMGMGAVMGSKRLKAIVIQGGVLPPVANPGKCEAITAAYATAMQQNALTNFQFEPPGFAAWVHLSGDETALWAHNYRESQFASADAYDTASFMKYYKTESPCPGCPNNCIKVFGAGDSKTFDVRAGGIHQEITGALGMNLGMAELETVIQANIKCNELGLDPTSLGFTISMAMECREEGLLSTDHAAEMPAFGDAAGVLALIPSIAARTGIGDLLAEGSQRAAGLIGNGTETCALHVKGLEMVPFEPRTQTNLALGYATAPIGPRYDICEHDWDYDVNAGWSHTLDGSRTLGIQERVPMQEISPRKVRNFHALNTLWAGADVLDFCIFAIAPTRILTLPLMTELLAAVTGWSTSSWEIMRFGERRNQLMRVYNLREGLTAADDTLPDRFFDEPITQGTWSGQQLDRVAFSDAVRTYYRIMGWNDLGFPRYETLLHHHLDWTVDEGYANRV